MAEVSNKTQVVISPHLSKYCVFVKGTKNNQNDTLTVSELSSIDVAILICSNALETYSVSGNVITLTSTNTGTVAGIVIGDK